MDDAKKLRLKADIAVARSPEEADAILEAQIGLQTYSERKAFLQALCDCDEPDVDKLILYHWLARLQDRFKEL